MVRNQMKDNNDFISLNHKKIKPRFSETLGLGHVFRIKPRV